jgi:hypothetical protein
MRAYELSKISLYKMVNDNERFAEWITRFSISTILAVPGVMELCQEEFNDAWIKHCEEETGEDYDS